MSQDSGIARARLEDGALPHLVFENLSIVPLFKETYKVSSINPHTLMNHPTPQHPKQKPIVILVPPVKAL